MTSFFSNSRVGQVPRPLPHPLWAPIPTTRHVRDDPDAQTYSDLIERVEGLMRDARRRLKLEQL